jgi:hypothetical protein
MNHKYNVRCYDFGDFNGIYFYYFKHNAVIFAKAITHHHMVDVYKQKGCIDTIVNRKKYNHIKYEEMYKGIRAYEVYLSNKIWAREMSIALKLWKQLKLKEKK